MSSVLTIVVILVALLIGLALAYVPMRLLLESMARNIKQFIERQRERRQTPREGAPDRRAIEKTREEKPSEDVVSS